MIARRSEALLALAVLALAASAACGKKGLPKPPQWIRPKPAQGLRLLQRGDEVVVSLAPPKERTDGEPFEQPVQLRVTLLPEAAARPGRQEGRRVKQRPPSQRPGSTSWVVPRDEWPGYAAGDRLEIPIHLASLGLPELAGKEGLSGRRVSFVVEVQEGKRWRSAPAGPIAITLCAAPAPPARAEARPAPTGILVWWPAAEKGAPPVQIYRAAPAAEFGEKPYRTLPAGTTTFLDETAEIGAEYRYEIRFGRADEPNRCESASATASATRIDVFPPARPVGLAAAAEDKLIRLFWTPGPELDIAGYLVYRSDGPREPFRLLTATPIPATTYADTDVRRGTRYTYVVSAVDGAASPNESGWSEPAEEILP
ncbi:MAG: fibronectin type III domain-containing protein [Acidobacteria bacterium]|nr:fibronectin type III domain-containing protein [Acidobacteriota bacterium]